MGSQAISTLIWYIKEIWMESKVFTHKCCYEVTQFEIVASVGKISEAYLVPVLEQIIKQFTFKIISLHSDNGSEYINFTMAKLLKKLFVEMTKSRPLHSNDNALAESKNTSVVRKHWYTCIYHKSGLRK